MSTNPQSVQFILDQLGQLKPVRARAMFGEYALYYQDKVVGLICDNTLFVKNTPEGAKILGGDYPTGSPYPGAKPHFMIADELLDQPENLCQLVAATAAAVPLPKRKKGLQPT